MNQVKVLFLASNPADSTRLSLDEEARGIERRLRASKYRDAIVLKTWWAVQPDDLLQALNEELPHVVHFSGHGRGQGGLVFHDELGNAQLVSGAALKRLFLAVKGNIRVVLLNACYSSEQANAIAHCIDCVIGMKDSISDKAARKFSASFYRAVAFGLSIQNAFDQGLASIALEVPGQEDLPVLLVRQGVSAKRIFILRDKRYDSDAAQPVLSGVALQHMTHEVPNKRMQKSHGDRFLRSALPNLAGKIRHREDLSLIMLDIDELTIINKQYGRRVGNNVIAAIARILFVEGGTEYSGRCGDDTYYMMLPGFGVDEAERMAGQLSLCVEQHPWESLAADLRVSCTFGVSQLQAREPIRDWVIRAAIAMNTAKKGGASGKIGWVEEGQRRDKQSAEEALRWAKGAAERRRVALAPLHISVNQSRELSHYYS